MNIILLGPPGAGKGTQASKICEKYNLIHISTGDIFRKNIKEQTELGLKVTSYLDKGMLVPDDLTEDLVADRLLHDDVVNAVGFMLDGFPRNIHQANFLKKYLSDNSSAIDHVINIKADDEKLIGRVVTRRVCRSCGATYNINFSPTKVDGVCDKCGGEVYQRADDTEETLKTRLLAYHKETAPLIDYYTTDKIIRNVDGTKAIDSVFEDIKGILG